MYRYRYTYKLNFNFKFRIYSIKFVKIFFKVCTVGTVPVAVKNARIWGTNKDPDRSRSVTLLLLILKR